MGALQGGADRAAPRPRRRDGPGRGRTIRRAAAGAREGISVGIRSVNGPKNPFPPLRGKVGMGGATPTLALPRRGGGNRSLLPPSAGEELALRVPKGWDGGRHPHPRPPPSRGRESTLLPRRGGGNRRSFPPLRGKSLP